MYANLRVEIDGYGDEFASEVVIENGELVVTLDELDHDGRPLDPVAHPPKVERTPVRGLPRIRIRADF